MSGDWIGGLMFLLALVLIFSGYPVAFALAGTALMFLPLGIHLDLFDMNLMQALPQRVFTVMDNFTLLAVPYFIFMGTMLERSKLAEDLLKTMGQLFGPLRGGLALAVVLVGTLLAAATGVVGATVVAMGMISLPVMLRYGYSKELSTGIIAASGTLGQVIPPSVVLIVLGDQLGVSVGDLFIGSLLPGVTLAVMYAMYALAVAKFKPNAAPALPISERASSGGELFKRVCLVMIPPLVLILLVLGLHFRWCGNAYRSRRVRRRRRHDPGGAQPPAGPEDSAGHHEHHHQADRHGHVHPGGLPGLQSGIPWFQRRPLGGQLPDQSAGRPGRLPDCGQSGHFHTRFLYRFL